MKKVYGDDCLSRTRVYEWFKRFQEGRKNIRDDEYTGCPKTAVFKKILKKCVISEKMSQNVRCVTWIQN